MILIVAKFRVRPDRSQEWLALVDPFTQATRAEEGNVMFEWSRSVDDPHTYVLVEGFRDAAAGSAHVGSDHFRAGIETMTDLIAETPQIINVEIPDRDGWSRMAEMQPRTATSS
jgi:quinol monooxygenase YgiN